jgi:hypothetical protein
LSVRVLDERDRSSGGGRDEQHERGGEQAAPPPAHTSSLLVLARDCALTFLQKLAFQRADVPVRRLGVCPLEGGCEPGAAVEIAAVAVRGDPGGGRLSELPL